MLVNIRIGSIKSKYINQDIKLTYPHIYQNTIHLPDHQIVRHHKFEQNIPQDTFDRVKQSLIDKQYIYTKECIDDFNFQDGVRSVWKIQEGIRQFHEIVRIKKIIADIDIQVSPELTTRISCKQKVQYPNKRNLSESIVRNKCVETFQTPLNRFKYQLITSTGKYTSKELELILIISTSDSQSDIESYLKKGLEMLIDVL